MDHTPSLPKSFKGATELLIWVDLFTGYVNAKASVSRTAQTIAESYEDCVFRRFVASEAMWHDRELGFMADRFRIFNRIVAQRQRSTMAYQPQANGTAERMVQTLTRSVKIYVADTNQRDWDVYAERLTFALNTAQDRVRGDSPFSQAHGWDPRTTLEALLPLDITRRRYRDLRSEQINRMNELVYMASKLGHRSGYISTASMRVTHLWQGPFRVVEMVADDAAKIEIAGSEYHQFPTVHVSKLKLVRRFPDRPQVELVSDGVNCLDFDEALLTEDSWEATLADDEFEVDQIVDVRSGRRTRYGRVHGEFMVYWKGYAEQTWVDEAYLNCGALLQEFERKMADRNRFQGIQSHKEGEE
ncbi:unnamed protein product [Phytophthora fragariaefolia]|uniref:Unnamed protein product n=1 Tax=Phytophthora fragariaefolia TaxID=1490495 RepID=A0A9W6XHL8_9STRA|nr:unnamed protein product [Phytophthora fragariaefolia]